MSNECPECNSRIETTNSQCSYCGWPDTTITRDSNGNVVRITAPRENPSYTAHIDYAKSLDLDVTVIRRAGEPDRMIVMNPINSLIDAIKNDAPFAQIKALIKALDEEQLRWALGTLAVEYGGIKRMYDLACKEIGTHRATSES